MHFVTKVATITSMIVIIKDQLRECRSKDQEVLFNRHKPFSQAKKTEIGKAVCLFCDNEDFKDNVTAVGKYHSVGNDPNTIQIYMESLTENLKKMAMQLERLDSSP